MIEINNESTIEIDESVLLRLVERNLAELRVSPDAELAIVLIDEGAMEQLHLQWMDEPGPTDVLAPMDELGLAQRTFRHHRACSATSCSVRRSPTQAQAAKHSTMDELILLTTHGLLHLLGFDHAEPEEHREMFGLQKTLIDGFAAEERRRS